MYGVCVSYSTSDMVTLASPQQAERNCDSFFSFSLPAWDAILTNSSEVQGIGLFAIQITIGDTERRNLIFAFKPSIKLTNFIL